MEGKSKTFVKGIKLPQSKAKKARKAREREGWDRIIRDEHDTTERASPRAPLTTFPGEDLTAIRTREDELAGDGIPQNASDDLEADGAADEVGWKKTIWEDVKVGDFVKIYKDEGFPAGPSLALCSRAPPSRRMLTHLRPTDIAICATSEEEDIAYIETKNLDGETNLKSRHAVAELAHLRSARSCATAQFRIDCEAADVNMFRLNAAVVESEPDGQGGFAEKKHPISLETTLLRGCVLRNTAWVIGVVIFTGADTKIVMNSGNTPSKRSKVERQMNPQVSVPLGSRAYIRLPR
jgi:phospholipid-translocating ATPase